MKKLLSGLSITAVMALCAGCKEAPKSVTSEPSSTQATPYVQPDPLPGESMDQWARRSGQAAGTRIDVRNGLAVVTYKHSNDGKCIFPAVGYVQWNSEGTHVKLVDQEYEDEMVRTVTYSPWIDRGKGQSAVLPEVEFAPGDARINVEHTLYWAPHKLLAAAAQIEGFKRIDLSTLGTPEQLEEQQAFGARWADPSLIDQASVNPHKQIIIPARGESADSCDTKYIDKWRNLWIPFTFPGSTVIKRTHIQLELSTPASVEQVEQAYLSRFPHATKYDSSADTVVLNLYASEADAIISRETCAGCKSTSISISSIIEDIRLPDAQGFRLHKQP